MRQELATIPPLVLGLTAAGALPFVGLATMAFLGGPLWQADGLNDLMTYGAVILAFMGAVHWGLALAPGAVAEPSASLLAGVIPALVGWGATMLPPSLGFIVLALSFIAVLGFDFVAIRNGAAPSWYGRLRLPVTLVVVLSLMAASFAA
ncbi:MAG: DUF3429 domain-containing protein [Rhizomicrobium sp.]